MVVYVIDEPILGVLAGMADVNGATVIKPELI
jgi:hypothetical protein